MQIATQPWMSQPEAELASRCVPWTWTWICPTLLIWGADDRVVPKSYARKFADRIAGPTEILEIPNAGHLVDIDQPAALAEAVLKFLK